MLTLSVPHLDCICQLPLACVLPLQTLSSTAFSMMVSATLRRSLKVSLSNVVPLGRPSRRNMSSQWSWDRCSPRTYFSTGIAFCTQKQWSNLLISKLIQKHFLFFSYSSLYLSSPTPLWQRQSTLYLSTSACNLTDMAVGCCSFRSLSCHENRNSSNTYVLLLFRERVKITIVENVKILKRNIKWSDTYFCTWMWSSLPELSP